MNELLVVVVLEDYRDILRCDHRLELYCLDSIRVFVEESNCESFYFEKFI